MPRKPKAPRELTTEQAVRRLFPKEGIREAKKVVREQEKRVINPKSK